MSNISVCKCEFVKSSELFDGYEDLMEEWSTVSQFNWGENNHHTLVLFASILDEMEYYGVEFSHQFSSRVPFNMYVDLEN